MIKIVEQILLVSLVGFVTNKSWIIFFIIVFILLFFASCRIYLKNEKDILKKLDNSTDWERNSIRKQGFFPDEETKNPIIKWLLGKINKRILKKWIFNKNNSPRLSRDEKKFLYVEKHLKHQEALEKKKQNH